MISKIDDNVSKTINLIAAVVTISGTIWGILIFLVSEWDISLLYNIYLPLRIILYVFVEASFTIFFSYPISYVGIKVFTEKKSRTYWLVAIVIVLLFSAWQTVLFIGLFFSPMDSMSWVLRGILPISFSILIFSVQGATIVEEENEGRERKLDSDIVSVIVFFYGLALAFMAIVIGSIWADIGAKIVDLAQ